MAGQLTSDANNTKYEDDPILRPLLELGMQQRDLKKHKTLARASILVLFFRLPQQQNDANDWHILFTQRPLHLKSHPGEVCFPGGKQDDEDDGNDVTTALRETTEEVGIPRDHIQPVARLETVESVGGLCVTPIVAVWIKPLADASSLQINKDEVEAAFYVPLSYFWNEDNCIDKQDIEWRGGIFTLRTYHWNEQKRMFKIWGLTAHVIYEIAQICKPTNNNTCIQSHSSPIQAGPLYRYVDDTSSKPYWAMRFFVLSTHRILHQYDSERKANAKADTATKKNRLSVDGPDDCQVTPDVGDKDNGGKYSFTISVLEGRVTWTLAATSREERDQWISALSQQSSSSVASTSSNKKLKV